MIEGMAKKTEAAVHSDFNLDPCSNLMVCRRFSALSRLSVSWQCTCEIAACGES